MCDSSCYFNTGMHVAKTLKIQTLHALTTIENNKSMAYLTYE